MLDQCSSGIERKTIWKVGSHLGYEIIDLTIHLFADVLKDSKYLEDVKQIVDEFDASGKPRFRSDTEHLFVRFGTVRDNDPSVGIKMGQIKLTR